MWVVLIYFKMRLKFINVLIFLLNIEFIIDILDILGLIN